jgi:hypothetical protein
VADRDRALIAAAEGHGRIQFATDALERALFFHNRLKL